MYNLKLASHNITLNEATNSLKTKRIFFQPKLTINQPNDIYEQEADAMAEKVMRMPDPATNDNLFFKPAISTIQHKCAHCEEEEKQAQRKEGANDDSVSPVHVIQPVPNIIPSRPTIQSKCANCKEEEKLQRKEMPEEDELIEETLLQTKLIQNKQQGFETENKLQAKESETTNSKEVSNNVEQILRSGGAQMDVPTRLFMEERFGYDFKNVQIHNDASAHRSSAGINAKAYTHQNHVVFGKDYYRPHSVEGKQLLAHELTHVIQQNENVNLKKIQLKPGEKKQYSFHIKVPASITQQPLIIAMYRQAYGIADPSVIIKGTWTGMPSDEKLATLAGRELTFSIDQSLYDQNVQKLHPEFNNARDNNEEQDADKKRQEDFSTTAPELKKEIVDEIDKEFYKRSGKEPGYKIQPGDKDDIALWKQIQTEVLKEKQIIDNMPPAVKELFKGPLLITPDNYKDVARIAYKLSQLSYGELEDYKNKINAAAADLSTFESAIDRYIEEVKQRKEDTEAQDKLIQKLYGLEALYQKYKKWNRSDPTETQALNEELKANNFPGGILEFEKFIADYLHAFRTETVKIGLDILMRYESVLYKEGLRYQNPSEVGALYQQLAPLRAEYPQFEKNAREYNDFQQEKADYEERKRLPGNGGIEGPSKEREAAADLAGKEALKHREAERQSVIAISGTFPILKEDNLPLDRRLDKAAMAKADTTQLMALLKVHIEARREDIKKTEDTITSDPDKIFTLDKLLEASVKQQNIEPTSIFGQIVQDKISIIKRTDIIIGFLVAVFAIALTILSFGTGIIAAGAAVTAFGLSSILAYQEFKKYESEHAAYGAGLLSDDPSLVWLIVSIAGAALDLGQAVKAVKAISPLAKTLDATKDLIAFNEGIKALEKAGEIDSKIARNVEQAALARTKAAEAAKSLSNTLISKTYSFPGPLADPDLYRDVVKLAFYKIKEGGLAFQQFALEVRQARTAAKMADFTADELVLLKRAYEEGKAFTSEAELIKYLKQTPLSGKSIILDENMLIARDKVARGIPLQEGEKRMMDYLKANPDAKLAVPEELYDKVAGKMNTSDLSIIDTTSKAGSTEYDTVIKLLEDNKVGATKGVEDRRLITEALFAKTDPGVTPSFVTHDAGIYKRLYMLDKTDPNALKKLGKSLADVFPDGFDVVINGKKLRVIPVK